MSMADTPHIFGRCMGLGFAAALLLAGASAAQAQRTSEDVAKEAEVTARAKKDAAALRSAAEAAGIKPLLPTVPVTPDNVWVLNLSDGGNVRILLRPDVAPGHVERIKSLTRSSFYNGLVFHRVIDGFMAQGGDPKGDGTGGSEMPDLKQEFTWLPHMRGTVSMARSESEDSANSQFYIMLMPRLQLDHKYTVVGRVISGMDGVDKIEKGEPPANPTKIVRAYIEGDNAAASIAPPPAG
jgi:cyclophilin family peptidyl-prolyl cis-trans isomerase